MKKILILGGGFAGIESAIYLRKHNFDVTLISNRNYLYIYPTSIWIPVGSTTFDDVSIPLTKLQKVHGFTLIIDEILQIKTQEHRVVGRANHYTDYDYLVVAMGSGKVKHEGLEYTKSICGQPEESLEIKAKLDALIEKGFGKVAFGFGGNPKDPSNVRGGPAFELMFNFHNKLKKLGLRDKFELTMFAPMEKPGAKMGEKALVMMERYYKRLGIKKQIGKKIKRFEDDGVVFEDDAKLESDFVMFIPAGSGHKVFEVSDLPLNETGLIKINDYCEVEGLENVYAAGDSVAIDGPEWRAKQGHVAEVMARNIAHNIALKESGEGYKEGYISHLNILCVMDSGDGAGFVYRDTHKSAMIPMPIVGHWMKKGWGWYFKNSKLGRIPRLPGM